MVDQLLRRFGIVVLILALPGLVVPAIAVAQSSSADLSAFQWIVIGLAYGASFAAYVALIYFTVRAYRRRALAKRSSSRAAQTIEPPRLRSRPGIPMVIVGGSLVLVGVLGGLANFLFPASIESPIVAALGVFVPGLLGIGGLVVAIVGGVRALVASAARPT